MQYKFSYKLNPLMKLEPVQMSITKEGKTYKCVSYCDNRLFAALQSQIQSIQEYPDDVMFQMYIVASFFINDYY